jgi:GNAT superfamily N-acetyltransferase
MPHELIAEARAGFRRARPADAGTIVAIVNAACGDRAEVAWTSEAAVFEGERTYPAEILQMLAAPQSTFLLRLHEGEVAGCAYLKKNGNAACMEMLAVRPRLQGAGFGRQIVAEAERIAREELKCTLMTNGWIKKHTGYHLVEEERNGSQ